ncbi:unnamed protein product [Knipowitschia caucasica]|uniref:Ribosomal protein eL8/eL30/eS12/Gadd45 domain-containing protein n=1 Tax=Knipowitschia caucasica TaxID=637954 RepID=A0AAV2KR04_KNICA
MTLEEVVGSSSAKKMETVSAALETLLDAAQRRGCLTVGVYESAKLMNVDPDSVVLCVLASDAEEDIALQIHFTLLQAFCCDNSINILRVRGLRRLGQLLDQDLDLDQDHNEGRDLHCLLVTNPPVDPLQSQALSAITSFCAESRVQNLWVPALELQAR